jgi:hypothetical protein
MTELINEKKCKDCAHHTGDACDNSNSDHYGHMLTPWHQACGQYDDGKHHQWDSTLTVGGPGDDM